MAKATHRLRSPLPGWRVHVPIAVAIVLVVTGCFGGHSFGASGDDVRATSPTSAGSRAHLVSGRAVPLSFAVVGDSVTAGGLPIDGPVVSGPNSWVPAAQTESDLTLVDGWARPGAQTTDMLAGVHRMDADVLVVMAGTNDIVAGRGWVQSSLALAAIVAIVGAPDVVVVAIAPNDAIPATREEYNRHLERLSAARGWRFVDPWTAVDDGTGRWVPGASPDGKHPQAAAASAAGRQIGRALAALS